jgi:DtxR family manganese transport transcriptional regulator
MSHCPPSQPRPNGSAARGPRNRLHCLKITLNSSRILAINGEARPIDIARRLGVSHPTAAKSINRLKREGLATSKPYRGVFLTEAGLSLAERVRTRHRIVVQLLEAVGVPPDTAEADAEGIEHYVSDASLRAFSRFLKARG